MSEVSNLDFPPSLMTHIFKIKEFDCSLCTCGSSHTEVFTMLLFHKSANVRITNNHSVLLSHLLIFVTTRRLLEVLIKGTSRKDKK